MFAQQPKIAQIDLVGVRVNTSQPQKKDYQDEECYPLPSVREYTPSVDDGVVTSRQDVSKIHASIRNDQSARKSFLAFSQSGKFDLSSMTTTVHDDRVNNPKVEKDPKLIGVQKAFEEFFIVSARPDPEKPSQFLPCSEYMYFKNPDCDRRAVVPDFCLNEGLETTPITTEAELHECLWFSPETRFVFTLNNQQDMEKVGQFENQTGLNCLCLRFADFYFSGTEKDL